MSVVLYVMLFAYLCLGVVFLVLSRFAVVEERKKGEKRYDALGREY
jgi:hypothetical protein